MTSDLMVVGNWKMHGLSCEALLLVRHITDFIGDASLDVRCVLCPPFTQLLQVSEWLRLSGACELGAQDCHHREGGAFTGDISPVMLKDAGCRHVILGHSERRQHHGETDALVCKKATAAMQMGMTPIICVGESEEEQQKNRTIETVEAQVLASVPDGMSGEVIIAYEPVWAIGSGKMPALRDIEVVHGAIAAMLLEKKKIDAGRISVLYGGSVKPDNAQEIMGIPDVGGVLAGGASLIADDFCAILSAAGSYAG